MEISKDKQYKTREGLEVRIYATDGVGPSPVHGAVLEPNGWVAEDWTPEGMWDTDPDALRPEDLIEVIKVEFWLNVYPDGNAHQYFTRSKADAMAMGERVACVKIECEVEEGEGLKQLERREEEDES